MTAAASQPKTYSKSLSRRFILRILFILLIGQCISIVWSLYVNNAMLKHDLREKLTLSGKQLASLAVVSRGSFDFTYLGQLIDELIKDADIQRISYVDKGVVIVDRKGSHPTKNILKLDVPVVDGGEVVGSILFEYTDYRIVKNLIKQTGISVCLMACLYVALALFVYFFFKKDIGAKINSISRSIDHMSKGDLTWSHTGTGNDEFGVISGGLELLTGWLATTIDRYKTISENVAEATDLLNKTFRDMINGVNSQHMSTESAMHSLQRAIDSLEHIIVSSENLLELSDESSSALNGILATAESIVVKMDRLSGNVNSSYDSVAAISRSSGEVAVSAERAKNSMEFASAAVVDINKSVTRINGFVRETTELAQETDSIISNRGIKSVQDAIDSMHGIEKTVDSLSGTITNLDVRSKDIAKVLDVIKEVTEQTKLLSLNAQILSGQAGEHGRPFAVVASEMKSLSDKTAISTKEIESIVSSIQGEIHSAVKSTNFTSSMVTEGKSIVARAGEALQSIRESSSHSLEMIRGIDAVAAEQNMSLQQIMEAFAEVRKLISEVNRATREEELGMKSLLEGVGAVRIAVEVTRKASEEQARSIQLISENVELANDRTRSISTSAKDHREDSHNVMRVMETIIAAGAETVKSVRGVSSRILAMSSEVESLKREIRSFKTDNKTVKL